MTESNAGQNPEHNKEDASAKEHWERSWREAQDAFAEVKQAFGKMADAFAPSNAACDHFRQSRIEFLKGMRELIDHQISRLSKEPNRGTRVTVE